jgi:outer membrane protein assembly factor BamD (BamD/ComL family)
MKRFLIVLLTFAAVSCNVKSKEKQRSEISNIEKKIHTEKFSQKLADEFLKATTNYLVSFPNDSMAPVYLFKQSDMYLSINKPEEAIAVLKRIEKDFSNHRLFPDALLQMAIIYDNILSKKDEAKVYYHAFINRFPNHKNIIVANQALLLIDANPEEMVKRFKANDTVSKKK